MLRVVVIDDSAAHRILVGLALERAADAEIVGEARDGHEGLSVIARTEPDVAIVDIHMPGMGGLELIQHLRMRSALGTRLVAYSADTASLIEAVRVGAHASALKSADTHDLLLAVAAAGCPSPSYAPVGELTPTRRS